MKKRLLILLSAVLAAAFCLPLSGCSKEDDASVLVEQLQAFEETVTFNASDAVTALQAAFEAEPELYYFFGGVDKDNATQKGSEITLGIEYINTDVDPNAVVIVNNSTDLYNAVGLALAQTQTYLSMVITDSSLTDTDITDAISSWKDDNYLIYMGYSSCEGTKYNCDISTWTAYSLTINYIDSTSKVQEWREDTQNVILDLCETEFAQDMPDYQKALIIHDYLVDNVDYVATTSALNYTAYGALVNGSACSEGYARAASLLFTAAGLANEVVAGAGTSEGTAWNCVEEDGQYYWIDASMDDYSYPDFDSDKGTHGYFNLTDYTLNADHSWQTANYPTCNSTTWTYDNVASAIASDTTEYTKYSTDNVETIAASTEELIYAVGIDFTEVNTVSVPQTETAEADEQKLEEELGTDSADTSDETDASDETADVSDETAADETADASDETAAEETADASDETAADDETDVTAADDETDVSAADNTDVSDETADTSDNTSADTSTGTTEKKSHVLRNIIIVILVLVAAYAGYRYYCYRQYLARKRRRQQRRTAAGQGTASAPRTRSSSNRGSARPRSGSSTRPRSGSSRTGSTRPRSGR